MDDALSATAGEGLGGAKRPAVLVAEDDYLIGLEIAKIASRLECDVMGPARRLSEVYEILASSHVDVALLDIRLRDDESVYPAADELRRRHIPFAFVTAYGRDAIEPDYQKEPVLEKPFTDDEVAGFIQTCLSHSARPESVLGPRIG